MEQRVFTKPIEVEARLRELDLTEQLLLDAVKRGFFAWLNCTQNHPPAFAALWLGERQIVASVRVLCRMGGSGITIATCRLL